MNGLLNHVLPMRKSFLSQARNCCWRWGINFVKRQLKTVFRGKLVVKNSGCNNFELCILFVCSWGYLTVKHQASPFPSFAKFTVAVTRMLISNSYQVDYILLSFFPAFCHDTNCYAYAFWLGILSFWCLFLCWWNSLIKDSCSLEIRCCISSLPIRSRTQWWPEWEWSVKKSFDWRSSQEAHRESCERPWRCWGRWIFEWLGNL